MKTLNITSDLHLNVLQVAVESEQQFLTDALADASHAEDHFEYGTRLLHMNQFAMLFYGRIETADFHDEDPAAESLAMALDKLRLDQCEVLANEGMDLTEISEIEERITAAEEMLNDLRPEEHYPNHYGSRH